MPRAWRRASYKHTCKTAALTDSTEELGPCDEASGRWPSKTGTESIQVEAAGLEPISYKTKQALGLAIQQAAQKYKYQDPTIRDMVLQKLYDLAARERGSQA